MCLKILIVRNSPTEVNLNSYNNQEVGLAKSLIDKGHDVGIVFYTSSKYHEQKVGNIKIYYLPAKTFLNYSIYDAKIYDIADKYDIIQTSEYNQIMSYKLAKKYKDKIIVYHGPYYRRKLITILNNFIFDIIYLKRFVKLNPMIITKSNLATIFLEKKGFKKVKTVGVGLDNSKFKNKEINREFELTLQKDKIKLLNIATIEKRKNTLFLLKVLKELNKENNKYILYLIGKPISKYKNKCIKYIDKNNLKENVVFIDNVKQSEVSHIYENIDIYLLPSNYEIFGMVLLEAINFNKPIISSLNGGSSFLLNDFQIIQKFDEKHWANKIKQNNKNLKKYKNSKILWKDIVKMFEKYYKDILNK